MRGGSAWPIIATILALDEHPCYLMDRKATIAYANPAMHEAFQWPTGSNMRGMSLDRLIPTDELRERVAARREYFDHALPRPSVVNPLAFQRADGSVFMAASSASPIPDTRFIVVKLRPCE